jgi:protein-tyrosine phosphatase
MRKKILIKDIQSILFVCYGNTCRSPMAEGLAKKKADEKVVIESAGIVSVFEGAQDEAIAVMKEFYEVDIFSHRTRNVIDLDINRFDWILPLDSYVFEFLKLNFSQLRDRMVLWEIMDPFGRGLEMFKKCAKSIQEHIDQYLLLD